MSDYGVDDKFMKELGEKLEPGSAAVLLLVRKVSLDKVLPQIKIEGHIIQTSLNDDQEEQLADALAAAGTQVVAGSPAVREPSAGRFSVPRDGPLRRSASRSSSRSARWRRVLAFGFLVVLAVVSLGTLLSIFVAAVLALGLDPVVGALVKRGWKRGRAALVVFAALFLVVFVIVLVTAGPLWDEIKEFVASLPAYWEELKSKDWFQDIVNTAGIDDKVANLLKDLAAGLPDAASALLGVAGGVFGSLLSMVTLTFLALFLLMERPTITKWLFGFTPPEVEQRWSPVVERSIFAVSQSLLGNVAISIVAGTVAFVSSWLLGLPFPIVLAVIAGFLDLIPQVGATIAVDHPRRGGADGQHRGGGDHADHPADLPAGRELHRLPDRLSPGDRDLPLHDDRRGADRVLDPRGRRRDPGPAVRRRDQDRRG